MVCCNIENSVQDFIVWILMINAQPFINIL
jgi:hypothetical protein